MSLEIWGCAVGHWEQMLKRRDLGQGCRTDWEPMLERRDLGQRCRMDWEPMLERRYLGLGYRPGV